jgi:SAM-dependent methyltransferase
MRRELLGDLVCPVSAHPLTLVGDSDKGVIEIGELECEGCGSTWPIRGGVPRLVPADLVEQQQRTAERFGWQWQHFAEQHPEFEAQFLDWLDPLTPESFRDKRVLDAGCGTGRHAYYAATYGAREVVALDLSGAVEAARLTLRGFGNVDVIQGDLLRPPLRPASEDGGFDLVYSIGVLHHLPDPEAGFRSLLRYVRPGGTIAIWVYGYEGNAFVRNVVEPLRRVSTRIPPPLLRVLAWPLGLGFHGAAKVIYRPLSRTRLGNALPLNEYMSSVAVYSFRQNYGIVFDQLAAPTATYLRESDITRWFTESGLEHVRISHRHGNSWRGQGRAAREAGYNPRASVDRDDRRPTTQ